MICLKSREGFTWRICYNAVFIKDCQWQEDEDRARGVQYIVVSNSLLSVFPDHFRPNQIFITKKRDFHRKTAICICKRCRDYLKALCHRKCVTVIVVALEVGYIYRLADIRTYNKQRQFGPKEVSSSNNPKKYGKSKWDNVWYKTLIWLQSQTFPNGHRRHSISSFDLHLNELSTKVNSAWNQQNILLSHSI